MIIQSAAVKVGEDVYVAPRPARHYDILFDLRGMGVIAHKRVEGFVTDTRIFVDRRQAVIIARLAGQLKLPYDQIDSLFSEDIW